MTHRSVVALSLVFVVLLTSCTSGEETSTSDHGQAVDAVATSTRSDVEPAPETTPPAGTEASAGVVFDGSAGADSADKAVAGLLSAINSGDILGALAHLDPSERDLIADLYLTTIDASVDAWPQFGGDDAIGDLGLEVLALTPLRTIQLSDHLAWVETDEVEFYMDAPTEVAAAFFSDNEPWGRGSGYTREEIAHREDDWSEFTDLFGDSSDVLPGLIVAEIDGRWYVSFGRTMLELLRIDAGFDTTFPAERQDVTSTASATPEAAVVDFLTALAEDRMRDAAQHLVPTEGQVFADYPAMLDRWLPGLLDIAVDLDPASLRVVHESDGLAVVEASELTLAIDGFGHDEGVFDDGDALFEHQLQLTDRCLMVNDEDISCEPIETSVSVFTSIYRDVGWDGLRIVVVENDDGWAVSLYDTVAHYGRPLVGDPLYGLGYVQLSVPIFGSPLGYTLVNETAKTMPLQETDAIELQPFAARRLLIARIRSSDEGRVLWIDPSALDRECHVTIWNTDMVTGDWGEEPDHYDDEDCDDHLTRPIEIPAGVELTLTFWGYGEALEPIVVELR